MWAEDKVRLEIGMPEAQWEKKEWAWDGRMTTREKSKGNKRKNTAIQTIFRALRKDDITCSPGENNNNLCCVKDYLNKVIMCSLFLKYTQSNSTETTYVLPNELDKIFVNTCHFYIFLKIKIMYIHTCIHVYDSIMILYERGILRSLSCWPASTRFNTLRNLILFKRLLLKRFINTLWSSCC